MHCDTQVFEEFRHIRCRQVFGEEICGVLGAGDLLHTKVPPANPLLDPEVLHCDVPRFTEALTTDDANRSASVRVDHPLHLYAKVSGQRDEPQRLRRALGETVQLGLAA